MGTTSKDLLQLEHKKSSISQLGISLFSLSVFLWSSQLSISPRSLCLNCVAESTLLVCKNGSKAAQMKKPIIAPPPKSQCESVCLVRISISLLGFLLLLSSFMLFSFLCWDSRVLILQLDPLNN